MISTLLLMFFWLADVFESFRDMCLDYYGLDPAHYYTLPNFAWDAMLKNTKVKLDHIHDLDMYEMIESGLRGGMCQVPRKHMTANNRYMASCNADLVSSYIMYLDANNLYGGGMSENYLIQNLNGQMIFKLLRMC